MNLHSLAIQYLKVETTQFSADVIKSLDSTSNKVSISNSGRIDVTDGATTKRYDTNSQPYSKIFTKNENITITSASAQVPSVTSTAPSTGVAVNSAIAATFSEIVRGSTASLPLP